MKWNLYWNPRYSPKVWLPVQNKSWTDNPLWEVDSLRKHDYVKVLLPCGVLPWHVVHVWLFNLHYLIPLQEAWKDGATPLDDITLAWYLVPLFSLAYKSIVINVQSHFLMDLPSLVWCNCVCRAPAERKASEQTLLSKLITYPNTEKSDKPKQPRSWIRTLVYLSLESL